MNPADLLAATAALPSPVVLVFADSRFREILWNWIRHMEACGAADFLVIAMDAELHDELSASGVRSVRGSYDGTRKGLWMVRLEVFSALCEAGVDFVHSDADAVWMKNPLPKYFADGELDLLFSPGTIWPPDVIRKWGFVLCCGFFGMRATSATTRILREATSLAQQTQDDQVAINRLLCENGTQWTLPATIDFHGVQAGLPYCGYAELVEGTCDAFGARVGLLPFREFQRAPMPAEEVFVKHLLSPQPPLEKKLFLQRSGCWIEDTRPDARGPQRPPDTESFLRAGRAARQRGHRRAALEAFRAGLATRPGHSELQLECIREEVHLGNLEAARSELGALPVEVRGSPAARTIELRLLAMQDDARARENLLLWLHAESSVPRLTILAAGAIELGFRQEAVAALQAREQGRTAEGALVLARGLIDLGDFGGAARVLNALDASSLGLQPSISFATAKRDLGHLEDAAALLRSVATRESSASTRSSSPARLDHLFQVCAELGLQDACELLIRAADPRLTTEAVLDYLINRDRFDDARSMMQHAAAKDPDFRTNHWLARIALRRCDYSQALEELAPRLKPGFADLADTKLAVRICVRANRIVDAWMRLTEQEQLFEPQDLALERAELLRCDLRFEDEELCLRSALERDPWSAPISQRLAGLLTSMGNITAAKDLLNRQLNRTRNSAAWLNAQFELARRAHQDPELLRAELNNVYATARPVDVADVLVDELKLHMQLGEHSQADRVLDQLAQSPASASNPSIQLTCLGRLVMLGRHDEARALADRMLGMQWPQVFLDAVRREASRNEAWAGSALEQFLGYRNSITDPRHHVVFTDFANPPPSTEPPLRVLVMAHLYYADLWPEIRTQLGALEGSGFEMRVTLPSTAEPSLLASVRAACPQATFTFPENRGFDIGAHWQSLDTIDLRAFDVVLVLQTKKNGHTRVGQAWRKVLMSALIGTKERWRDNLWTMANHPDVGLVGSGLMRNSWGLWTVPAMKPVLEALGMPTRYEELLPHNEHVGGSMFMIRANLLAEIHARTRATIFPRHEEMSVAERLAFSPAHALEMAIGMYSSWRGYRTIWRA